MLRRFTWVGGLALVVGAGCGGSSSINGSGGAGGASGGGGSGATSGNGGSGGSSASGGTGNVAGSGGSGNAAGTGGVPSDWTSCKVPSDCVLRSESCCGSCGAATRDDSIALNQNGAKQYATDKCALVDCPGCFMPQDPTILATCRGGSCVVVDLQKHESTACKGASDCRVRTNACCECGGPVDDEHLIAVSGGAPSYDTLVCDPGTACLECAPAYPPKKLVCEGGHCAIDKN